MYRAQAGSPAAQELLNELFQRHYRKVAIWCLRLTGEREAAADLAQDVFLKAFKYLDSFRGEARFTTWLYSITRNHCFNQVRSRALTPDHVAEDLLPELVDPAPGPQSQLERDHAGRVTREMMRAELSELETQVMNLHYVEELPLDSIGRLLKLENASGAKAYIVSARRKLSRATERWRASLGRGDG